uniref:DDE-1 domain-containing protein n=1 Tax=Oncorhynchus mykiss TaxID=8022 RepID=A0A8C7QPE1_ONCMY
MKFEDFRGGPSWCLTFMRRKGLSIRVQTSLCQQLPPDYEEKVSNFRKFTDAKIEEHSIGPHDIINMDEVPLTFDLPLTRTVNRKGESSVKLKTTGHEKTHFTCVLSCTASGEKLPPMFIFKRMTMPKEKFQRGIVMKVNKKGWMTEGLMHEWHTECYGKRPGGFFHKNKALLVLDSMRVHITDSVKEAIKRTNSIPAVIPGGTTKYLQPLDISVNRAFKVALRVQWEAWMTSGEKSFTKTGRMRRATYGQVCQWILTAWSIVKKSTIINGFRKAGLLRVVKGSSAGNLPPDESDESDNENDPTSDEAILRLFNSDTEGDDFSGFSAQEEEDSDQ